MPSSQAFWKKACAAGIASPLRSASIPRGRRNSRPRARARPSSSAISGPGSKLSTASALRAGGLELGRVPPAVQQRQRPDVAHPLLDRVVLHEAVPTQPLHGARPAEDRLLGGLGE